ncbi:MAG: C13 family peptidase [bacterium]
MVQLGLVGHWSNNHGYFRAVEVIESEAFKENGELGMLYAFCATSQGMAVFSINTGIHDPNNRSLEVSLESFVPVGDCTDIAIQINERGGYDKDIYAYLAVGSEGLYIRNINNPKFSYHLGHCDTPGIAEYVIVSGDYAYVADGEKGLQVIDIHEKNAPVPVGTSDTPGYACQIAVSGDYAYVADWEKGLQVINIDDKNAPKLVKGIDTGDYAGGIAISGDYVYVADWEKGLQVIDINIKDRPVLVGTCRTPGYALDVVISGNYAYVGNEKKGLQVIDINNKNKPEIVCSCDTPGFAGGIALSGDYAFVADWESGLQVIDIKEKIGPALIGTCDTPGSKKGVAVSGDYVYVADGNSGLQVIGVNNKTMPAISGACQTHDYACDVAVFDDYAYVADRESGLQVIDISKKEPEPTGNCDTPGIAHAVAVSGDYAYVADSESGLQVIDISQKNAPFRAGSCDTPGLAMSVAVSGDYAYVADGESGLQVIDITKKNTPVLMGTCNTLGIAGGVAISGDYAYVADGGNGLQVIDITKKNDPVLVGCCDTLGYAGWITVSNDYAFVIDEDSGLLVIDISNKHRPVIVGGCTTPGYARGGTIFGDYAYVTDGGIGLQVIDISNKHGPVLVGSCDSPGSAEGVAVSGDYAYVAYGISGLQVIDIDSNNGPLLVGSYTSHGFAKGVAVFDDYVLLAVYDRLSQRSGLLVINIGNKNDPMLAGICNTPGDAVNVAVSGDYAYVADGKSGLQVIDLSDPNMPVIAGTCNTPGSAMDVVVSGDCAYVADGRSGLQVIDIGDPYTPVIVGTCDAYVDAVGIAVSGNYAYVADEISGLQVIDIRYPNMPVITGTYDFPGEMVDVTVSGDYAYIADGAGGLAVIDVKNKYRPVLRDCCDTPGYASGVTVTDGYAYVADKTNGLLKFKIHIGPSPKGKGNLILAAGGDINYKSLSQQHIQTRTRPRLKASGQSDSSTSRWNLTQSLAKHVVNAFVKQDYMACDFYYLNPDSPQDIDDDGIPNQLIVDDSTPTSEELQNIIKTWPQDHIANEGPLYIYLIGKAAENHFLIMSDEIITAQELRNAINTFQHGYTDNEGMYHPGTNRQVVVIIESAASGTFIDELTGPDITVITATGNGASYIKPSPSDPEIPNCFTTSFIDALAPHLGSNTIPEVSPDMVASHIIGSLKEAFFFARDELETWALEGPPFNNQVPQMAIPESQFCGLYFSEDGITPVEFLTIRSIPGDLTLIGERLDHTFRPISQDIGITFFSSDHAILVPEEDIQKIVEQYSVEYSVAPRKNGRCSLIAHADPNLPLSANITIEVSVDDPNYDIATGMMAIIAAGYKGTGDYLWESTNTIANHAYKTLRAMGYTKDEIHYYNPYVLQDLDDNGIFDEIDGYPTYGMFDPNACGYLGCSPLARIRNSASGIKELFVFLVDHGGRGTFTLNPKESLSAHHLIDQIAGIADKVQDKILLLYDACYSGSFIEEIEQRQDPGLSKKLIAITSTDPNQIAYYLNQGLVSFSYPFFDEWRLTNSINSAFTFAEVSLPPGNQIPCVSGPNLVEQWDQDTIYYVNESRPVFGEVEAYRRLGTLNIMVDVFSLTGIREVWAIVENAQNSMRSTHGAAVTEATFLPLSPNIEDPSAYLYGGYYTITVPDPCPSEANYLITLYAKDKSTLPKIASYHTGIADTVRNKTKALIISSATEILQEDVRKNFHEQIMRAQAILESKGLSIQNGDILHIAGEDLEDLEAFSQILTAIPPLGEEQILFLYLIGTVMIEENNIPRFYLNHNIILSPQELRAMIPSHPAQRLLILMDAPYSSQFLSLFDPYQTDERWSGMASTDKEHLFFPLEGKHFPCFSNFFFSMVLSGATISEAFRMAQNAVSLTRQNPGLFPKGKFINYQTINRYLNYYLGTPAIHGEDYALISDCQAKAERIPGEIHYQLSLAVNPDAIIDRAWAILSSPSCSLQKSLIVDFDPNTVQISDSGLILTASACSGDQYYNIYFMVEGSLKEDMEKTWTEWMERTIARIETNIIDDPYEPDDDPGDILFDSRHEIFVNAPPIRHTFYHEYTDWIYFYGLEGHVYEIYSQDLSEYGYFIQLALFSDPNERVMHENGQYLVANNYLAFSCKASGYYLLNVTLASTYPPEGVEYIIGILDPQAEKHTTLLVEVIDPAADRVPGVRCQRVGGIDFVYPNNYRFASPDRYYYKFNGRTEYENLLIQIFEGTDFLGDPIETTAKLIPDSLNKITMDLSDSNCMFDTNTIPLMLEDTSYMEEIEHYQDIIGHPQYQGDANHPWLSLNTSQDFSPNGDFDGDQISNLDEVLFFQSSPIYPTVTAPLNKGINLFYLPSIVEMPNIISNRYISYQVLWFDPDSGTWVAPYLSSEHMKSNTFNAIYASGKGTLSLDLTELNNPILSLKGFLKSGYSKDKTFDPNYMETRLFDLNHFFTDTSSLDILVKPDLWEIESIRMRNNERGTWETSYRFFERPAGVNHGLKPYEVYIVNRKKGSAQ